MLMSLLLSEASLHTLLHESHHAEEHHEICDGHDHDADEGKDSICSHEHQCELCVLIQSSTNFLSQVKSNGFTNSFADEHFQKLENDVCIKPLEVSSPRAPPVA